MVFHFTIIASDAHVKIAALSSGEAWGRLESIACMSGFTSKMKHFAKLTHVTEFSHIVTDYRQ